MAGLIFLLAGVSMMVACAGYRGVAIALFGVSSVAAVLWFDHHMTDPLALAF